MFAALPAQADGVFEDFGGTASISGTVTTEDGRPLKAHKDGDYGTVYVFRRFHDRNHDRYLYFPICADGTFAATGLRPGTYVLEFLPSDRAYEEQAWENQSDIDTGTPVVLGISEARTGLDVTLKLREVAPTTVTVTNTALPKISGKSLVGKTLKVHSGTWQPADVSLAYQWFVGGKPVAKATKPTFKLTKAHAGSSVRVAVTATTDGVSTKAVSKATAKFGYAAKRKAPSRELEPRVPTEFGIVYYAWATRTL